MPSYAVCQILSISMIMIRRILDVKEPPDILFKSIEYQVTQSEHFIPDRFLGHVFTEKKTVTSPLKGFLIS